MAAAQDSDAWAGEPQEDEEQERMYNRMIADGGLFAWRKADGWCPCDCCFPTANAVSEADLTDTLSLSG
jgi:hypothetical protein